MRLNYSEQSSIDEAKKQCLDCEQVLPVQRFYREAISSDGYTARCRVCHRSYSKANAPAKESWIQREIRELGHWGKPQFARREYYPLAVQTKMLHSDPRVKAQYQRQSGACYYCGVKVQDIYQVDHVVPTSRGGENEAHNIVIACVDCNHKKGARMPHEWADGGRLL